MAKRSAAWLALFGAIMVLWASVADARTAKLTALPAQASIPSISLETLTGEPVDLASLDASSVMVGPLVATMLAFDFSPSTDDAELRIRLPEGAVVLEWQGATPCTGADPTPAFSAGTWMRTLRPGRAHTSLLYVQPLRHGRATVVSVAGHGHLSRLAATLTDEDGRELAEPVVLTDSETESEVIVQTDDVADAYRASDLAMIRARAGGERVSTAIRDAMVVIDTSASSAWALHHRIAQAKSIARVTVGNLALLVFDQSAEVVFKGAADALDESNFQSVARRGALGATNIEAVLSTIEALAKKRGFQRVIFLSDGIASAGSRDRALLTSRVVDWARFGIRRLDVVAPKFGSDLALLEAMVTAGLGDRGRVLTDDSDLIGALEQPSAPDLAISIPGAISQSPRSLVSPVSGDERWVMARVAEGITLRIRDGNRTPRPLDAQPAWRPLFERYFEAQGQLPVADEAKRGTLSLQHGQLSISHHRGNTTVLCVGSVVHSGRLPPESIQRIVRLNFGRFRGCAVQNHRAPIVPKGRVTARFIIGRDGLVSSVTDMGSTVPDPEFVRCVLEEFTRLQFAAPPKGPVTVVYPLVFGTDTDENENSGSTDESPERYVPVKISNPDYPLVPREVGNEAYEGVFGSVLQAIKDNKLDDAERAARGLLDRDSVSLLAHLAWGKTAEARGNRTEARRAYGSLLDRFSGNVRALRVAAAWLSHLGDPSSLALAFEALRTAIRLNHGRAESERELAWLLAQDGAYEAALEQLTLAFLHVENGSRDLITKEIGIVAAALVVRHPERQSVAVAQLRRTGAQFVSSPELVFALQNESNRELALSLYANPSKGRLQAIRYSEMSRPTAYEIVATERKAPYAVRVTDRGYPQPMRSRAAALGCVRVLDYDGHGNVHVELRPFVLQVAGTEVDLSTFG